MDIASCPVCRLVNHASIPRCLNCGSPMVLPTLPEGVDLDDLPAAPPPAGGYGWSAAVPGPPSSQRDRTGTVATVLGIVAVVVLVVSLVMLSTSNPPASIPTMMLALLLVLWIASGVFGLWMLIDAISSSRVVWALAIFFLGVFGALGYALLGKTPRGPA